MLRDAVAVTLGYRVLAVEGVTLGRGPRKVVTADLDVVVGKLAELVVIHTKELSLLGSTKLEAGDLVDDKSEEGADDKRVAGTGENVDDLLVDGGPSTGDGTSRQCVVDTVETNNVPGTKDAVEEKTPHSSDTVLGEDIEGIVDLDPELDCKDVSE